MKALFVLGHPSDVHFFRHTIAELDRLGHCVSVIAIRKEILLDLLSLYGLKCDLIGGNTPTLMGKALTLLAKDATLIRKANGGRPDIIVSFGSPYAAHASAVLGVPHIAFTDTEIASISTKLMLPFTDAVCTPSSFTEDLGPKQIRFKGYKELAYLHPNRFTANPEVLERLDVRPDEKIVVVRFGRITASHDLHRHGLRLATPEHRLYFVRSLEARARVFVTSELPLDPSLHTRIPRIPLNAIHDLLYYASLYIGDGATMASESGVLGTPWVYVSDRGNGTCNEQQMRYGLGFRETSAEAALARGSEILQRPGLKSEWKTKRDAMLAEKVDVSTFTVDLIRNWPPVRFGAHGALRPRSSLVS